VRAALLLAWRSLAYYRVRALLLVGCVALVVLLPVAVQLLVGAQSERLTARADATPLVAGAKGSRYDLVLNALYFRGRTPAPTSMAEADRVRATGFARAIPLLARASARGRPLVGTTPDYYRFRGLETVAGTPPLLLGDAALGAGVARALGAGVGDTVRTDLPNLYDLGLDYTLDLHVAGVFAPTGTADDGAVFVDLKTAWIVEGVGHGHAAEPEDDTVLKREPDRVVLNEKVRQHQRITRENIGSFHFHAEPGELPLTAILVLPHDARSATKLKGRYRVSETGQLLVPSDVVAEILGFVFQVKRFFDAHVALVGAATALFLVLVVLLTLRVRRREIETLRRIGASRADVARIFGAELALAVGTGAVLGIAGGVVTYLAWSA